MNTNSKILQKLDEILSCITRLDQAFKSTSFRPAIQYNKCEGYGHVIVIYPVRVNIDELPRTKSESDSEEFIYHVEEPEDYDSDEEIQCDNIEEPVL